MENVGKVSIWIGQMDNKGLLDAYMKEVFNDEGDSASLFMSDFLIDYIDPGFQEVDFISGQTTQAKKFEAFSYADSFLNQLPEINTSFNCIICLYNIEYNSAVASSNNLSFIGCFNYKED